MMAIERVIEMVNVNKWKIYRESDDAKARNEMSENPDTDPHVIFIAIDGEDLYPSLEKHETAKRIRGYIEKSDVNFEDVNISDSLVNLKLNESSLRRQGILKDMIGFLPNHS